MANSSATKSAGTPAPANSPGGVYPLTTVKSCAGFTAASAAEMLGIPAADIKDESQDLYETARTCSFVSTKDASKSVAFTLRRDESVQDATAEMASLRSHLETAAKTPAGKGVSDPYSDILNLGDEAVWSGINESLTARRGNITIVVMSPHDKKLQAAVAQKVFKGL